MKKGIFRGGLGTFLIKFLLIPGHCLCSGRFFEDVNLEGEKINKRLVDTLYAIYREWQILKFQSR